VARLRSAGFDLVPTFKRPHYTVAVESAMPEDIDRLLDALGPAGVNPYHHGRGSGRR
jgi:hypothetical protein